MTPTPSLCATSPRTFTYNKDAGSGETQVKTAALSLRAPSLK